MTQRPSIRAIFAWANERYSDHWPGLFAIGFVVAVLPLTQMVLEQGDSSALHPWVRIGFFLAYELVALLGTAAMVLMAISPEAVVVSEVWREALHDAPRLVAVKIAALLVRGLPALGIAALVKAIGAGAGIVLFIPAALVLMTLGFIAQMAFASAVIERTGPVAAIVRAFRRANDAGMQKAFLAALLFALVASVPFVLIWVANTFFPPSPVQYTPHVPGFDLQPFPMTRPGTFASGIPWWMFLVLRLAAIPVLGYLATLYAGAALEFALADTTTREKPDVFSPYA